MYTRSVIARMRLNSSPFLPVLFFLWPAWKGREILDRYWRRQHVQTSSLFFFLARLMMLTRLVVFSEYLHAKACSQFNQTTATIGCHRRYIQSNNLINKIWRINDGMFRLVCQHSSFIISFLYLRVILCDDTALLPHYISHYL